MDDNEEVGVDSDDFDPIMNEDQDDKAIINLPDNEGAFRSSNIRESFFPV